MRDKKYCYMLVDGFVLDVVYNNREGCFVLETCLVSDEGKRVDFHLPSFNVIGSTVADGELGRLIEIVNRNRRSILLRYYDLLKRDSMFYIRGQGKPIKE